ISFVALVVLVLACRTTETTADGAGASTQPATSALKFDPALPAPPGTYPEWTDPSVEPCQDFFQFACGGWLKATQIPADKSRWAQFTVMQYRNLDVLKALLEEIEQGKTPDGAPYASKLKDFYGTCMNEAELDKGLPALKAELKPLDEIKDVK